MKEAMNDFLVGSWKAESSNIPNYVPGREWLHFTQEGTHIIEMLNSGQDVEPTKNAFTMQHEGDAYRFCPTKRNPDDSAQFSWRVSIARLGEDKIAVTPDLPKHGFTTIYRRDP